MLNGLTSSEVQERIKNKQTNKSTENTSVPILTIVLQNALDLPNMIILFCVIFLLVYGLAEDALMISVIMFMNFSISIFQELRARYLLSKLKFLRQDKIIVIRDGKEVEVDNQAIVLDDIVKIQSGQYLYVDGILLDNEHLLVDESVLTGESDYVRKKVDDELFSGSFVTGGKGIYRVTKVGKDSFVNKIAHEAKQYINIVSPLQKNVNNIVKVLLLLTILTVLLLFGMNYFVIRMDRAELLLAVISIVTSMIPQGIILTVTAALTLGTIRMAKKQILVQRLNAVETLAGVNVLCMDKTGTLTENKLKLIQQTNLSAENDALFHELIANYTRFTLEKNKTIKALESNFQWTGSESEFQISEQMPFNSKIKQSGLEAEHKQVNYRIILGSLESISSRISEVGQIAKLQKLNDEYARQGYRNLFMAYKKTSKEKYSSTLGAEDDLEYLPLAFFSLEDKLRENAREIIQQFIDRKVKPVIISGDNPQTLLALMQKLGIKELNRVISGSELAKITNTYEFDEAVLANDIFARVTPEQKVQIVKSFQKVYKYVGMIGDGVNDALAIKHASLGIALGSGADAAKNISDIVLLDDNLANLTEVITEGRRIIHNSRRGVQLIVAKNMYALVILVIALLFALPFPFNTRGLFLLSFFIGSFTALSILSDTQEPPMNSKFLSKLYTFILTAGLSAGLIGIGLLLFTRQLENFQTILLSFLILTGQFNYIFSLNNEKLNLRLSTSHIRSYISIPLMIIFLIVMYVEPLAREFLVASLSFDQWMYVIIAFAVYILTFGIIYRGFNFYFARKFKD